MIINLVKLNVNKIISITCQVDKVNEMWII